MRAAPAFPTPQWHRTPAGLPSTPHPEPSETPGRAAPIIGDPHEEIAAHPRRARRLRPASHREIPLQVLSQQLPEPLVQVRPDRHVALIALVHLRELFHHPLLPVQRIPLEVHRARLQHPVRRDHQKPQPRLAPWPAVVFEKFPRVLQRRGRRHDPVRPVPPLLHPLQLAPQLHQVRREQLAVPCPPRRVGRVAKIHAPLLRLVRVVVHVRQVGCRDARVQHDVVEPVSRALRHHLVQMVVESGNHPEIVMPPVREIQRHRKLIHPRLSQPQVPLRRHQRPRRHQNDIGQGIGLFDVPHHLLEVVPHQRLAPGHLHHARLQRLHVPRILLRPQVPRIVPRSPMVAVAAIAGARIGHLERHHDGPACDPVQCPLADDFE